MTSDFLVYGPINNLSLGNVTYNILLELFRRGLTPFIVERGQTDLSSFNVPEGFKEWLEAGKAKVIGGYKRTMPCLKIWHIADTLERHADHQVLLTFHETDRITATEENVLNNQSKIIVTSKYSREVLLRGYHTPIYPVSYVPLAFDADHFKPISVKYPDDRIVFSLTGKAEIKRKWTFKTLETWIKKYGNNPKYYLNLSIHNFFYPQGQVEHICNQIWNGKKPFNVNPLPFLKESVEYNKVLNSAHIALGVQGSEGFNLPLFHSLAVGKHAVVLNAHAHRDYCNDENSVLIEPAGLEPIYDNFFFREGQVFNQGNTFSWSEDDFIEGCEKAIARVQKDPVNHAGLKLQEEFTYAKTVDGLLDALFII